MLLLLNRAHGRHHYILYSFLVCLKKPTRVWYNQDAILIISHNLSTRVIRFFVVFHWLVLFKFVHNMGRAIVLSVGENSNSKRLSMHCGHKIAEQTGRDRKAIVSFLWNIEIYGKNFKDFKGGNNAVITETDRILLKLKKEVFNFHDSSAKFKERTCVKVHWKQNQSTLKTSLKWTFPAAIFAKKFARRSWLRELILNRKITVWI